MSWKFMLSKGPTLGLISFCLGLVFILSSYFLIKFQFPTWGLVSCIMASLFFISVQLNCPPVSVLNMKILFAALNNLVWINFFRCWDWYMEFIYPYFHPYDWFSACKILLALLKRSSNMCTGKTDGLAPVSGTICVKFDFVCTLFTRLENVFLSPPLLLLSFWLRSCSNYISISSLQLRRDARKPQKKRWTK